MQQKKRWSFLLLLLFIQYFSEMMAFRKTGILFSSKASSCLKKKTFFLSCFYFRKGKVAFSFFLLEQNLLFFSRCQCLLFFREGDRLFFPFRSFVHSEGDSSFLNMTVLFWRRCQCQCSWGGEPLLG